jgi:tagatose 6-phosphate kinase
VILCVCPSPAIDVTYEVPGLDVGGTNRVRAVTHRPGGKAVNVARVLAALGECAAVLAPVGGGTGAEFSALLSSCGVRVETVNAGLPTRRTVTIMDTVGGQATLLSEQSSVDSWSTLTERFDELLPAADAVVISGSLPTAAPKDALAVLARSVRATGRPLIVDSSGPALAEALVGQPTVIKPNVAELADLTGETDPASAAEALVARHGVAVVASLGPEGLIAVDDSGLRRARPARPLWGNPTGAGDALVAGLARGLARGERLSGLLAECIALSAAAVVEPYAGEVDPSEVVRQRPGVVVERRETLR